MLFEDKGGALEAVIDGILVTKWKTAGDSVLGAKLLANPKPKTHLMVGAGTVAASIIDAYHEVFPSISKFLIWNRSPENAERLAEKLSKKISGIEVVTDLAAACSQADIVTSATMAVEPFLQGDWFEPGTHIDLIGAFKPNMREATDSLIQRASVFVDSFATTIGHIGEIDIPLTSRILDKKDIKGDFYDIVANNAGRGSPGEITLFKNGGGAHLDLMTSRYIAANIV